MDASLGWAVIGLVLVISEMLTGTFYLLMLGVAAFVAALVAWLGYGFPAQCIAMSLVAIAGCYGVHLYRDRNRGERMPSIDAGMPASFESWVDASARLARVRYRGASWDALVEEGEGLEPGAMLYVLAADGNTLKVTRKHP